MKTIVPLVLFLCAFVSTASCAQTVGERPQRVEDVLLLEIKGIRVEVWAEGLEIPWSLVFLPDGRALVSERPGRIRLISGGRLRERAYLTLDVASVGEGGLMGLALHPDFPNEPYIYAMHTYRKGGDLFNRVVRIKDGGSQGMLDRVIVEGIPGGRAHDGGRIAFGPDKMLYITTGETFDADLSQNLHSLGGKVLRVMPDGKVPRDNPFKDSPVYAYGLRNPQGLAWHPENGNLFASDHGPSGEFGRFGHDEINVIVKGGNYGWPKVIGAPGVRPYIDPLVVWKDATPPSGIAFCTGRLFPQFRNDLFVATLRSQSLIRLQLNKTEEYSVKKIERWFAQSGRKGKYGRLRAVLEGPDGILYFLTNDQGGQKKAGDRIYRIVPD